ncbi:hypothetical protein ACEWY4_022923 [Coilia grayii]|uniref:Uncharacterized protein n=1 Tax=Coilia grayii TaxID=363190 RepID=A0ABD1J3I6_9TELE
MQAHERTQQLVTWRLESLGSLWSHCPHCPREQCANTLECEINAISQHVDVSHKQACSDIEKASQFITKALQSEVQQSMALRMLVHRLEDRASESRRSLSEQVESIRQLKLQVEELQKHLQDKDNSLTQANQTIAFLKNELKDLHQQLHSQQSNHRMIQEVTEWLQDGESQPIVVKVEDDFLQNSSIGFKEEQDDAADAVHDDEDGYQCSQSDGADLPTEQTISSSADIKAELVQEQDGESDMAPVLSPKTNQSPPDLACLLHLNRVSVQLVDCCTTQGQQGTSSKNKDGEKTQTGRGLRMTSSAIPKSEAIPETIMRELKKSVNSSRNLKNHMFERIWPEVNSRVNYPLKEALIQLTDQELLDMDCNISRYCVSNLTRHLSEIGMRRVIDAWNAHRIPGKGIPNQLAKDGSLKKVPEGLLPHAAEAADLYQKEVGHSLTRVSGFGTDPLQLDEKFSVERLFAETYPDMAILYNSVVNKDFKPFQGALGHLINITKSHI